MSNNLIICNSNIFDTLSKILIPFWKLETSVDAKVRIEIIIIEFKNLTFEFRLERQRGLKIILTRFPIPNVVLSTPSLVKYSRMETIILSNRISLEASWQTSNERKPGKILQKNFLSFSFVHGRSRCNFIGQIA